MKLLRFIFILTSLISCIESKSAHLVGGEITYTCVGNNVYQIELIVYRDCNSTGAQLDNPASIGIFNGATGVLVQNLQVNKGPTKSVPVNTGNPCLLAPPNVCTQYAEYSVLVSLPPSSQGYSIAYQRCCRNATITNINNPDDWGMTISARIPPNDNTCNNSPQWNNKPPIVLCSQENLSISSAAIDPDNDSLHYKLCEIYHGGGKSNQQGSLNSPKPNPPGPPPYSVVPFNQSNTPANPIPDSGD